MPAGAFLGLQTGPRLSPPLTAGRACGSATLTCLPPHRAHSPAHLPACWLPPEAQLRETHRVLAERGIPLAVNQAGRGPLRGRCRGGGKTRRLPTLC